ncbi:MAG: DedA family protein [Archangium sp.]
MERIDAWLGMIGAWGYGLLGGAGFLEYIFPFFPGDVVLVTGGAWVEREDRSIALLFCALMLASWAGLAVVWRVGRALASRLDESPPDKKVLGVPVAQLKKIEARMRERSTWLLIGNRFMPGLRSVILLSAGAANVPLPKVLLFGGLSAAAFNALLIFVGITIGDNAEKLATFFSRFRTATFALVGVVIVVFIARWVWRRRRA